MAYFEGGRFTPVPGIRAGGSYSMVGDGAGDLWISREQGLFHSQLGTVVEEIPWAKLSRAEKVRKNSGFSP